MQAGLSYSQRPTEVRTERGDHDVRRPANSAIARSSRLPACHRTSAAVGNAYFLGDPDRAVRLQDQEAGSLRFPRRLHARITPALLRGGITTEPPPRRR